MAQSQNTPQSTGQEPNPMFLGFDVPGPVLPSSVSVAGLGVSIVFGVAAIVAVALRLWAQKRTKAGITIDAYLIIAALIITLGMCVLTAYMALCAGLGWPIFWLIGPAGSRFTKSLDGGQLMWGVSIACIRASLLFFYRRIFTTATFQRTVIIALGFNTLWLIIYIIVTSVTYSTKQLEQTTINYSAWLIANGCVDIIQDLVVLCLPLFVIRKLNMSRGRKVGIAALFWLGIFCVVASIARVVYFAEIAQLVATDPQVVSLTSKCVVWSTIQPCASIIAACLPTFGPLLRGDSDLLTRFSSMFASFRRGSRRSTNRNTEPRMMKQGPFDGTSQKTWDRVHSENSSRVEHGEEEQIYEMVGTNDERR